MSLPTMAPTATDGLIAYISSSAPSQDPRSASQAIELLASTYRSTMNEELLHCMKRVVRETNVGDRRWTPDFEYPALINFTYGETGGNDMSKGAAEKVIEEVFKETPWRKETPASDSITSSRVILLKNGLEATKAYLDYKYVSTFIDLGCTSLANAESGGAAHGPLAAIIKDVVWEITLLDHPTTAATGLNTSTGETSLADVRRNFGEEIDEQAMRDTLDAMEKMRLEKNNLTSLEINPGSAHAPGPPSYTREEPIEEQLKETIHKGEKSKLAADLNGGDGEGYERSIASDRVVMQDANEFWEDYNALPGTPGPGGIRAQGSILDLRLDGSPVSPTVSTRG